jgi:dihydrofolate synthase/folylpolyglutamate synthase
MNEVQLLMTLPEMVKDYDRTNIKRLLAAFGNPQEHLRYVHVGGTNGKGSTCAMIAQGLQEAGYTTGLYTSPYLDTFNERIQINRVPIPDADIERILGKVRRLSEKKGILVTFFERLTVAAFLYFAEQNVDYVVLEVGLGGRLDATNVITPVVSVITSVSRDHVDMLGDSLELIAQEKAGIIKQRVPVVLGAQGVPKKVIEHHAHQQQAHVLVPQEEQFELGLRGAFQQDNARLAAMVLRQLGVEEEIIRKALKETSWPGRCDFVRRNVLTDVAHNPAAIAALVKEVQKCSYKKLLLVFGVMQDKEYDAMAALLAPLADHVILTRPAWKRAADPQELLPFFPGAEIKEAVADAVHHALTLAADEDLVLITGSIFTVSEARKVCTAASAAVGEERV